MALYNRIVDEFTSRTDLSRQRRYQLRAERDKCCRICGAKAVPRKKLCKVCEADHIQRCQSYRTGNPPAATKAPADLI